MRYVHLVRLAQFILLLFFAAKTYAASPAYTTFQTKILGPNGLPLEAASVNFRFSIVGHSGTCVIYQEDFLAVDMTGSKGSQSFELGNGARTFPVPATTLASVFDNTTTSFPCLVGGPYLPSLTDTRKIVMQFDDGNGWQTVPQMAINSVPFSNYATQADKLGNYAAIDFLRPATLPNCGALQALRFNAGAFTCVTAGGGSGTVTDVTGTLPVVVTSTTSTPVISVNAGTSSTPGILQVGSNLTVSAGTISLTGANVNAALGSAPLTVGGGTLSGDLSLGANKITNVTQVTNPSGDISLATLGTTGSVRITSGTSSSTTGTGALIVTGGVGVSENLNVGGNIRGNNITASTALYGPIVYGGTTASQSLTLQPTSDATKGNILIAPTGGSVGIGTNTPARLLHVNGTIRLEPSALPGTPASGDVAIDAGDGNKLKWYNGAGWQTAGGAGGGGGYVSGDLSLAGSKITNVPEVTNPSGDITLTPVATTGAVKIVSGATSTTTGTGALIVTGGAGISQNLNVGGAITSATGGSFGATTTPANVRLQVTSNVAHLSGVQYGIKNDFNWAPLASSTGNSLGITNTVNLTGTSSPSYLGGQWNTVTSSSIGAVATIEALQISATNSGANAGANTGFGYGLTSTVTNSGLGTMSFAESVRGKIENTNAAGTIVNAKAGRFEVLQTAGTITDAIGLSVESVTATNEAIGLQIGTITGAATKKFSIRANDPAAPSYFAGNVGIGTTTPSRLLTVNGPMRIIASALPGSPVSGDITVDSADGKLKWYDGSGWQSAGGAGGSGYVSGDLNMANSKITNVTEVTNPSGDITLSPVVSTGAVKITSGALSTTTGTGALIVTGGVGISENLNVGSNIKSAALYAPNIYGGTASSQDLTLESTTHSAKGNIILAPNGGNVGIGIASPLTPLHIERANSSTVLRVVNSSSTTARNPRVQVLNYTGGFGGNSSFEMYNARGTKALPSAVQSGDVLGETVAWGFADTVMGKATSISSIAEGTFNDTSNPGQIALSTTPMGGFAPVERMRIRSDGNIGIGTTTPSRLLTVNGPMRLIASALPGSPVSGDITVDNADGKLKWYDGSGWQSAGGVGGGYVSGDLNMANSKITNVTEVTNPSGDITLSPVVSTGAVKISSGALSTTTGTGALIVTGGVGISENLNVGTNIKSGALYTPYIYGGTASSQDLSIESTSSGTKGKILIAPNGGYVGIGTTATPLSRVQITGVDYYGSALTLLREQALGGYGAAISFQRSYGPRGNPASQTISGHHLGQIDFLGTDQNGNVAPATSAKLTGYAGENTTDVATGGGFKFHTVAVGTTTTVERMRLDPAGNLGIGGVPTTRLSVIDTSSAASTDVKVAEFYRDMGGDIDNTRQSVSVEFKISDSNSTNISRIRSQPGFDLANPSNSSAGELMSQLVFGTSDTTGVVQDRMIINGMGNVGIGTSTPTSRLVVNGASEMIGNVFVTGGQLQFTDANGTIGTSNTTSVPTFELSAAEPPTASFSCSRPVRPVEVIPFASLSATTVQLKP